MRASDIYGNAGIGGETTLDTTNSTPQTPNEKKVAQSTAVNQGVGNNLGVFSFLAFVGILVGLKFVFEKEVI